MLLNYLRNYSLKRTIRGINSYTFLEEIYIIKLSDLRKCMTTTVVDIGTLIIRDPNLRGGRPIIAETGTSVRRIAVLYKQGNSAEEIARLMTHLSIALVYAALTYYHANREEIDTDLAEEQEAYEQLAELHYKNLQTNSGALFYCC
jgi:uncharacterized protein (DUF433 family)